jgi:hypothetical protein
VPGSPDRLVADYVPRMYSDNYLSPRGDN